MSDNPPTVVDPREDLHHRLAHTPVPFDLMFHPGGHAALVTFDQREVRAFAPGYATSKEAVAVDGEREGRTYLAS